MSKASDQKRNAFRLTANIDAVFLPITPQLSKPYSEAVALEHWVPGSIHDLSIGGLRLIGPLSLDEQKMLAVRFTLPSAFLREFDVDETIIEHGTFGQRSRTVRKSEAEFETMELHGNLVKHSFQPESGTFQYHISFIDMAPKVEEELLRFITLSQRHQLKHRRHLR